MSRRQLASDSIGFANEFALRLTVGVLADRTGRLTADERRASAVAAFSALNALEHRLPGLKEAFAQVAEEGAGRSSDLREVERL